MYFVAEPSKTMLLSLLAFGFRFASVVQILFTGTLLRNAQASDHTRTIWSYYGLAATCYLIGPLMIRYLPWTVHPIILGAFAAPFFFWAFTRCLLEDGFRLRPWHWAALLGIEL